MFKVKAPLIDLERVRLAPNASCHWCSHSWYFFSSQAFQRHFLDWFLVFAISVCFFLLMMHFQPDDLVLKFLDFLIKEMCDDLDLNFELLF